MGYLSLFSDPLDLATWGQRQLSAFNSVVDTNAIIFQIGLNIVNVDKKLNLNR